MTKHTLLFLIGLLLFACGNSSETLKPAPAHKSNFPTDGSLDLPIDVEISVTFDESITLASNHGITINNQPTTAIRSTISLTTIIIESGLEYETEYFVHIPTSAIINTKGVELETPVEFSFTTQKAPKDIKEAELVTENPSAQAVNLFNFLKNNYGVKSISSAMANVNWNLNEIEWVYKHTGKQPVIATFDYIHLPSSPSSWIDYSKIDFIEEWWNNNGVISASWHWMVPKSQESTDITYKPEETTFKAVNALKEGTWENDLVKADLEKIANYLKLLQQKNIPVIWRPFHEAAGNIYEYSGGKAWFWWGTGGAENYKELWIYMFNYFKEKGLNNLIWVWTTQTKDDDFYPGDEYVDMVGRDIYNENSEENLAQQFKQIQNAYPNKMVTLSEFGNTSTLQSQWNKGARWSYFMPWYDYHRTLNPNSADFESQEHEYASVQWWMNAVASEVVIWLDEMPSLK